MMKNRTENKKEKNLHSINMKASLTKEKNKTKKKKKKYTIITCARLNKNYITNATIVYLYFKAMP